MFGLEKIEDNNVANRRYCCVKSTSTQHRQQKVVTKDQIVEVYMSSTAV